MSEKHLRIWMDTSGNGLFEMVWLPTLRDELQRAFDAQVKFERLFLHVRTFSHALDDGPLVLDTSQYASVEAVLAAVVDKLKPVSGGTNFTLAWQDAESLPRPDGVQIDEVILTDLLWAPRDGDPRPPANLRYVQYGLVAYGESEASRNFARQAPKSFISMMATQFGIEPRVRVSDSI